MANVYYEFSGNKILWISIFSWFTAQLIKVLLELYYNKKIDAKLFIGAGGMPSSHSSFVMAMSTSIGFLEGFNSPLFAIGIIVSLVVMYDAAGVRRAAGKQAEVINMIVSVFEEQGVVFDKKLKELLGHTPIEVGAGAVLGVIIAILFMRIL